MFPEFNTEVKKKPFFLWFLAEVGSDLTDEAITRTRTKIWKCLSNRLETTSG